MSWRKSPRPRPFHWFLGQAFFAAVCAAAIPVSPGFAEEKPPYAPINQPLKIDQVPGKQIYYTVGNPGIPGKANEGNTSNAGFVVTTQGVVAFDALGTPSLGWDLLQQIGKIGAQPVRYLVVSHYHADHIYGLQAFKDHAEGIIVAQERASE